MPLIVLAPIGAGGGRGRNSAALGLGWRPTTTRSERNCKRNQPNTNKNTYEHSVLQGSRERGTTPLIISERWAGW